MFDEEWTDVQREQYGRIRDAFMKTGMDRETAETYARRAIEARRARQVRLRRLPQDEPTKDELYLEAMRYDIAGRSKMDKEQLLEAVTNARQERSTRR